MAGIALSIIGGLILLVLFIACIKSLFEKKPTAPDGPDKESLKRALRKLDDSQKAAMNRISRKTNDSAGLALTTPDLLEERLSSESNYQYPSIFPSENESLSDEGAGGHSSGGGSSDSWGDTSSDAGSDD
jgi:hypothetical protein